MFQLLLASSKKLILKELSNKGWDIEVVIVGDKSKIKDDSLKALNKLKIKIFADGADDNEIFKLNEKDYIKGFTTNPSLMRKANIKNYEIKSRNYCNR